MLATPTQVSAFAHRFAHACVDASAGRRSCDLLGAKCNVPSLPKPTGFIFMLGGTKACLQARNGLISSSNASSKLLPELLQVSLCLVARLSGRLKLCTQILVLRLQSAIDNGESGKLALVMTHPGRKQT